MSRNLGSLSSIAGDSRGTEDLARDFAASASHTFQPGVHVDLPAALGSLLLLAVLLAIAFERVLGLDRLVANALQEWRAKRVAQRRKDVIEARSRLERLYDEDRPG